MSAASNSTVRATFFPTPDDFRTWLDRHHDREQELWVGFHKKGTGTPSITWPEAVDQALCFGWIDGQRRRIDDGSYAIRFTPRKPGSTWSAVNIARAAELSAQGLMRPTGQEAFDRRTEAKSATYSYEQRRDAELSDEYASRLRANADAWRFFQAQPASYRKAAVWWVISAKQEATRSRRLEQLITDSAAGRTVPPLTRRNRSGGGKGA